MSNIEIKMGEYKSIWYFKFEISDKSQTSNFQRNWYGHGGFDRCREFSTNQQIWKNKANHKGRIQNTGDRRQKKKNVKQSQLKRQNTEHRRQKTEEKIENKTNFKLGKCSLEIIYD